MKHYEILFILPGTLTEDEVGPVVDKVKAAVSDAGATDVSAEDMGKNRLAYPIQHIRYGYFHLCHFQAEPDKIAQVQKKLDLLGELLRVLIKEYDPEKQKKGKINYFVESDYASGTTRPKEARIETKKEALEEKKKPAVPEERKKVSLEEIDKKLDEILGDDIATV